MNADIVARYEANRLRVVRQVRYSTANENCIDLVLFLNGLPVATVELKTDFTQSVQDAVDQYRFDRPPHPKGQNREPLLSFPSGALVHFAVSNNEVPMTTRLEGAGHALPAIQQGQRRRRGQPAEPERAPDKLSVGGGLGTRQLARNPRPLHRRAARCEAADQGADLPPLSPARRHPPPARRRAGGGAGTEISDPALGRFRQDELHRMVGAFPRGPARRRKRETVLDRDRCLRPQRDRQPAPGGAGRLRAHQGRRHDDQERGIEQERPARRCARRGQEDHRLHDPDVSLRAGGRAQLAATEGKRFAVIADEAHSSQTGEAAAKLKAVLSPEELAELSGRRRG